ncbi:WXG100 family type VII secretion target [Streptomyces sp. TRM70308]|uniref:WXG100 family type VII secretion target n=1 Tax=Streptomyces sp. TRM70308 TaxID=3131932 RepID=UPI003D0823B5
MNDRLSWNHEELTALASDLDDMQKHLHQQIERLNNIVDRVETGWRGSAARAYKDLQAGVNDDAVAIRKSLMLIEEAVRMSRDGFTTQELETLERFRRIQATVPEENDIFTVTNTSVRETSVPRSAISDL